MRTKPKKQTNKEANKKGLVTTNSYSSCRGKYHRKQDGQAGSSGKRTKNQGKGRR